MHKKGIVGIIIVIIVLALAYYFFVMADLDQKEKEQHSTTNTAQENQGSTETDAVTATFTNPQSEESVTVVFDGEEATLTGEGFDELVLMRARSADGARYVNTEKDIELWNTGDAVQISQNKDVIFTGNVGGKTDAEKMTSSTWTWQASTLDGEVTEPKKADAFTLTFNSQKGTISATTDCNAIFGPYEIGEGNALSFGPLAMTKKYCEGSQEQTFARGLSKIESFYFNGSGALVLEFASSSNWMLLSQ